MAPPKAAVEKAAASTPAPAAEPAVLRSRDRGAEILAAALPLPAPAKPQVPVERTVTVGRGDTLMALLVDAGVARGTAAEAISALREAWDPRRLRPGQAVDLVHFPDPETRSRGPLAGLSIEPDAVTRVSVQRNDADSAFAAEQEEKALTRDLVRRGATISSSLYGAARNADVPLRVLMELVKAYSFDVDFQRDIRPGDRFEITFEEARDEAGRPVDAGEIVFAEMVLSGKRLEIYRYTTSDGDTDFFNAKGESVRKALMRTPVNGARLSSGYGKRRHPILGYNKMHTGIDFAARTGTPILAAGDGVVDMAKWHGGYGRYVRLRHNSEYKTAYAHMNRFADGISQGVRVEQGQVIGYVGSTGRSTGAHLHFEVLRNGSHMNPLKVDLPAGRTLEGTELARFEEARDRIDRQVAGLPDPVQVARAEMN